MNVDNIFSDGILLSIMDEYYDEYEYNDLLFKYHFLDALVYNVEKKCFSIIPKSRCSIEIDKVLIGFVLKEFKDDSYIILFKSFLNNLPERVPMSYFGKEKHIAFYYKDLFNRYASKYIKMSKDIDLSCIKFFIPDILLLDEFYYKIPDIKLLYSSIYGEEKADIFFSRLYNNGILSIYKGKYYQWQAKENEKYVINNFSVDGVCDFLPIFIFENN